MKKDKKLINFSEHSAEMEKQRRRKVDPEDMTAFYESTVPWRPVNDYMVVERNQSVYSGLVALPQNVSVNFNAECQILRVSEKIKEMYPILTPGTIVIHASGAKELHKFPLRLDDGTVATLQFVKLDAIGAVMGRNGIIPLGRRVRVRRINEETVTKGGIIIPGAQPTADQSREGVVLGTGIAPTGETIKQNFQPFCKVRWKSWSEKHVEIAVRGNYDLIIPEDDIDYIDYDYDVSGDKEMIEKLLRAK